MKDRIICGDCLEVLPTLPKAKMIFADPPDNLGLKYEGFVDKWPTALLYEAFLHDIADKALAQGDILWLSYNRKYEPVLGVKTYQYCNARKLHTFRHVKWRFTFGQHNHKDLGNGYRPILRLMKKGTKLYPDAIREPSLRQTKYHDKRADPRGRVPDDVWEFPRVCGTFHERRKWHPNQHPEALIERIVKFSCVKGDSVIDMFGGTGTVRRVCKRLGVNCTTIEISPYYCEMMEKDLIEG